MTRIEYSTMALTPSNYRVKIEEAAKFVRKQGFDFGIQIHNSIEPELYNLLLPLRNDFSFSVHSPVFAEFFLNLAAQDYAFTKKCADKCLTHLEQFQTNLLFFHGFFMTETPMIQDMKNYRNAIRKGMGEEYSLNKSFIMNPDFFRTDIFTQFTETFREHYLKLKEDYKDKGLVIAQENDFPGIGSGLQRPLEIHDLVDNLWFDLGHFWASSLLHEFDFHGEANRIIDTKNIVGVHLNHNLIKKESPKEQIRDSHEHFYRESEMNLAPLVRRLAEKKIEIITLEIVNGDIEDIKKLFDWIG